MLIPAGILFLYLSIINFKLIYFLLLAMIPLSIEVALPGGFATDFPTEPLIVGLMFLFLGFVAANPQTFDKKFLQHPVTFLLIIHYCWILVSATYSADTIVSLKFLLAKTWYIITFVFLTAALITDVNVFKKVFWCIFIPLFGTVLYTLIRHSAYDFSFQSVNEQMQPFFRNHVNYACTLAQVIPFVILAITWYRKGSKTRIFLICTLIILAVAIYFAYTRSAWLSLLVAAIMFFVIKKGWMAGVLTIGVTAVVGFFLYMSVNNHYLAHEPDYEHTIYHPELEDHLISTFEGEDVSSAERIYRWVAGVRMWSSRPITGYGPGNFNNFYKTFTVTGFETYVSDNPERSSIHNYFLLVLTEQGIIGLIIFIVLTILIFIKGQQIYNKTQQIEEKRYVMAVLLCLVIIYVNTFLSDLIETDKIGSFYFICIALLVNQDLRNRRLLLLPVVRTSLK
jgi:O-antigen ligase